MRLYKHPVKKWKVILLNTLAAAALLTLLAVLGNSYVSRLNRTLEMETESYLREISVHVSEVLSFKMSAIQSNLELAAGTFDRYENRADLLGFLQENAARYGYLYMAYAGADGNCLVSSGVTVNLKGQEHFEQACSGMSVVSENGLGKNIDTDTISYSYPIQKDGKVTGVLMAITSISDAKTSLDSKLFDGQGFCHIVKPDGSIIVTSRNVNAVQGVLDFYKLWSSSKLENGATLEGLRASLQNAETGCLRFNPDGMDKYLYYRPLGINDWYLFTVVPVAAVSQQSSIFISSTIVFCVVLTVFYLLLAAGFFLQHRLNEKKIHKLALIDLITGGPNKLCFEMRVREQLSGTVPESYAMVSLNVEKFKLINDMFGREEGDRLLKHIFKSIEAHLSLSEIVCRTFGDHFMVLMKYDSREQLSKRLEEIWNTTNNFNQQTEHPYYLNFARGAFIITDPEIDVTIMQDRADVACQAYRSEPMEPGQCVFYLDHARMQMHQDKAIENRMEAALANREFEMYLQPQINPADGHVAAAEALVRWNDPERGLVMPAQFIPLFEKNGFIVKLDLFIFEEACRLLQKWSQQGEPALRISVNLSRVHLKDTEFLRPFEEIRVRYGVPANWLEFELTESILFENMERLADIVEFIHGYGYECSLDDFGSGYSSLNILKDVRVDELKLDRGFFVSKRQLDETAYQVVECIISLAEKLGIRTVAEGVEQKEQVEWLTQQSCGLVQGYYYSKPVPVEEFEARYLK